MSAMCMTDGTYLLFAFLLLLFYCIFCGFLMEFCDLKYEIIAIEWMECCWGFLWGDDLSV